MHSPRCPNHAVAKRPCLPRVSPFAHADNADMYACCPEPSSSGHTSFDRLRAMHNTENQKGGRILMPCHIVLSIRRVIDPLHPAR